MLKTLGEPRRCEIIRLVWSKEMPATEIANHFPDVTRSAISQHLGVLRRTGLVNERRDGTRRLYSVNQARSPNSERSSTRSGAIALRNFAISRSP